MNIRLMHAHYLSGSAKKKTKPPALLIHRYGFRNSSNDSRESVLCVVQLAFMVVAYA
jgi:hypothetical protein